MPEWLEIKDSGVNLGGLDHKALMAIRVCTVEKVTGVNRVSTSTTALLVYLEKEDPKENQATKDFTVSAVE